MEEIQEIKIAILSPDAEKIPFQTSNPVYLGRAQEIDSDESVRVYLKVLSRRSVFVESLCYLIAKFVGLPVPEPYLVFMTENHRLGNADINIPIFGSADTGLSSYNQLLTDDNEPELIAKLKKKHNYNSCAVFDEFIGNCDRHFSNLFIRNNELISIDHEKAIKEEQHFSHPNWHNTLISYFSNDPQLTRRRNMDLCCKELINYQKIPFSLLAAKTHATLYLDDKTINDAIEFLKNRIDYIDSHIRHQFNAAAIQQSLR